MNYIIQASTDIGIKKDTNQDSYCAKLISTSLGKMVFAVLCDGMGGLEKGELASATVVNAFDKWTENRLPNICAHGITYQEISDDWNKLICEYNEKIKSYGHSRGIRLGTTVTAILLTQEKYYIVNVGDTRAYEISDTLRLLTKDQTLVAREVELGNLSVDQMEKDPRRSVLLQCVGASDVIYPDFYSGDTQQSTVYMLCSDGFRHEINEAEIYGRLRPELMLDTDSMKENMDGLIELNKQRQEKDNITVVSIKTF